MNVDVDEVVATLIRIAEKRGEGEEVALRQELHGIPVPARALFAALILVAADRPLTGKNLATVGGFSRGTALRDHGDLIAKLRDAVPYFVDTALAEASTGESVETLTRELRQRDATIAELRQNLKQQEHDMDVARSYARDLHERYRGDLEEIEREQAEKVRQIRPVD